MTSNHLTIVPRLPPHCPWSDWTPPNVKWCERSRCSWITEPSNTWSNLSYLVVALLIHRRLTTNTKNNNSILIYLFAPAIFLTGAFSLIYHASFTRVFQVFDFLGMYVFVCLALALNSRRFAVVCNDERKTLWFYFWTVVLSMISIPVVEAVGLPIQITMAILVLMIVAQEIGLQMGKYKTHPQLAPSPSHLKRSLSFLAIALVCSITDGARIWCDPDSIVQGHALWHLLSSIGMWFSFLYYEQIDFAGNGEGVPLGY